VVAANKRNPLKFSSFFIGLLQGLCCGAALCFLAYLILWCLTPSHFPIRNVKFTGKMQYLTQAELVTAITDDIHAGFFRLKISTLQQHLLSLPWAKQVEVTRILPDNVVIRMVEHQPGAFWGEKGILSEEGTLIYPNLTALKIPNLPLLQGPPGKHHLVWDQYLKMQTILTPLKLGITEVVLAPRGAWHIRLSNGILVILGTNDILSRLRFFAWAYDKYLYTRQPEVAYVDLRYTKGMAVGWVTG
jgi:cell division protein FtsQ